MAYLDEWEAWVQSIPNFTTTERNNMLLSSETRLGLRITCKLLQNPQTHTPLYCTFVSPGKSFIELVRYVFTLPDVTSFLSQRICQDALENFFGCQRQRGGVHDNPNVQEFTKNTQALRVINSFCKGPVRGNCRGNRSTSSHSADKENIHEPLPKRRRTQRK